MGSASTQRETVIVSAEFAALVCAAFADSDVHKLVVSDDGIKSVGRVRFLFHEVDS